MEGREVQRHVGANVLHDPLRHLIDLGLRVVLTRNQQIGELEPNIGLLLQVLDCFENRRQVSAAHLPVKPFSECFQVDVGGVHMPEKLFAGFLRDIAGRDRNGLDAVLVTGLGHIDGVFQEDHGVVVGERDAAACRLDCSFGDRSWRSAGLQLVQFA